MEASGPLLGLSWAPLRRLLGALGRLLTSLGRLLDASWAIGGRSWAFLGWFGPLRGSILAPWASPGLDFKRFGDVPGKVLEASGSMFWHAFCCTSHFVTKSFFHAVTTFFSLHALCILPFRCGGLCAAHGILKELVQDKLSRNFKRPKNGEDGSDFDDFWTKRIAALSAKF